METINLNKATISRTNTVNINLESKTKADRYAYAERRMLLGKKIVISGFVVSTVGVIVYCAAGLNANLNQQFGDSFLDNSGWPLAVGLATIGLGTFLWLIGSFIHLKGAMGCDPEKSDFNL